jgi:hypothetical protein
MIDWKENALIQNGCKHEIVQLVVRFQTPIGLMDDVAKAFEWCRENNMEFHLCVSAVAVALDSIGRTEIL